MNNPYYHILEEGINSNNQYVRIYRSFEITKNKLFLASKKREKYGAFNQLTAMAILRNYIGLIQNKYKFKKYKKLKIINKLYNYFYIFIYDIFITMPKIMIALYKSAIDIIDEINDEINDNKLKKYTKKNISKIIKTIKKIFIENLDVLIRLPYQILITINNYSVINVFSIYNGLWLDKEVSNHLNQKYKMEMIIIMSRIKKINTHIILYILQYLILNGGDIIDIYDNAFNNKYKYTLIGQNLNIII